jgi:hypothetical protein
MTRLKRIFSPSREFSKKKKGDLKVKWKMDSIFIIDATAPDCTIGGYF